MPETADIVLRTIAVMGALLLAGVLMTAARRQRAALPGALFALAVAAFFVSSAPGSVASLGIWAYPLVALCVTKAVWFWLFAQALFSDDARLQHGHLAIAAAVAAAGAWQQIVFLERFRLGAAGSFETAAGFGVDAVLLGFVILGLNEAWRDMDVDLVEGRRRLRLGFIAATGIYLVLALGVQTFNLVYGVQTPAPAAHANMLLAAATFLAAAWLLLQPRTESWLDPGRKAAASPALSRAESALLTRLERALAEERIHLQEGLTIGKLARHLGAGEHVLRRVINHGLGHRNFNDFLHTWRIREACDALAAPEQARLPVLSIAMQVGYGSVGPFNRAFKARIGMTPTDFRRRNLNGASLTR